MGHEQEEGGKWPYAGTAEAIKALGAKHCVKDVTISFWAAGGCGEWGLSGLWGALAGSTFSQDCTVGGHPLTCVTGAVPDAGTPVRVPWPFPGPFSGHSVLDPPQAQTAAGLPGWARRQPLMKGGSLERPAVIWGMFLGSAGGQHPVAPHPPCQLVLRSEVVA